MSIKPLILTVDIGTSSLKAALIGVDGRLECFDRETYAEAKEILSSHWENALSRALARLFKDKSADFLKAVCISANGPTFVPYTFDGQSLAPILWRDTKTVQVASAKSFFLPHSAYFAQSEPLLYEKTKYLFSAQEWLSFMLGAEPVTALPNRLYEEYYWNDEQCALFGVDSAKFPPFVAMGSVIGAVSDKAASRFFLKKGVPIVAGAPDFIAALIGAGALKKGIACDRAGTSEGVNLCEDFASEKDRKKEEIKGLRVLPHIKEGLWNIGGLIPQSGSLFDQYRAENGWTNRDYGELLAEIIGEKKEERGLFVLQTMAAQVKNALNRFQENGFSITEMRVSGGQAKNPLWNKLKADLTGCTLLVPEIADCELAGDACLAETALGEARDIEEASALIFRIKEKYEPDFK